MEYLYRVFSRGNSWEGGVEADSCVHLLLLSRLCKFWGEEIWITAMQKVECLCWTDFSWATLSPGEEEVEGSLVLLYHSFLNKFSHKFSCLDIL